MRLSNSCVSGLQFLHLSEHLFIVVRRNACGVQDTRSMLLGSGGELSPSTVATIQGNCMVSGHGDRLGTSQYQDLSWLALWAEKQQKSQTMYVHVSVP